MEGSGPCGGGKKPLHFLACGVGKGRRFVIPLDMGDRKHWVISVVCCAAGRTSSNIEGFFFWCWAGVPVEKEGGSRFPAAVILSRVGFCEGEMGMPSLPYG